MTQISVRHMNSNCKGDSANPDFTVLIRILDPLKNVMDTVATFFDVEMFKA